MIIEKRLADMGIELYLDANPIGNYLPYCQTGNLVYISGQGPAIKGEYKSYLGKVGDIITKEEAKEAARITAINLISLLKRATGDLDRVKRIVSVHGYVNSVGDFTEQPFVINGASDVLVEVFGEKGKHSRCAVSVPALPLNICVEVEMVAEIDME